jgi:DNA primase small subunit
LNETTTAFLRQVYKRFYFQSALTEVESPEQIGSREFGYIPFGGSMIRHLSFPDGGALVAELVKQAPSSVYCSNAVYANPAMPMDEKEWEGAELIFDIDATDIPTSCKKSHDLWYCESCHSSGRLPRPPLCPKCRGKTSEFHGSCEVCLGAAKDHASRVQSFLEQDFGVSSHDIRHYFSGNRGYHVHVYDKRFLSLDQQARAEIGEYIKGTSTQHPQAIASTLRAHKGRAPAEGGWMRRIRESVDSATDRGGTVQKLVREAISAQAAAIDLAVTTDIHRVFRLAGTLHGNTGLQKKRAKSLDKFDPAFDPVVIGSDIVRLNIAFFPKFTLKGEIFGPFKSSMASLPAYAAINILTRGLGEVI